MRDIANQLCLRWARMGEKQEFLLTDDFTRSVFTIQHVMLSVLTLSKTDAGYNRLVHYGL